ncbi:unnamed protein product [Sphagnum troendelagicum]
MFHHRACASVPSLVTLPAVFLRPLYYSSSSSSSVAAASFCSFPRPWRRSGQPWRVAGGRRRVCASWSSSLPPAGMAEGFKALKLEDDGVPVETVSGNGVSHPQGKGKDGDTTGGSRKKLEELNWDNSFTRELPGDTRTGGPVRQVLHACYSKVSPSVSVKEPELVAWSQPVADILDLDPNEFKRADFPLLFTGVSLLKGGLPYAQCYGGHQFGVWAGQLGDGRAITLGEVLNNQGERWELQLKGAGKTPYSRTADGLAVLRSSVREFLCSEAMHHLGIPTTRALCLVTTGEGVLRDMFYDGNVKMEPGAVVCRVAPSFIRFGTFQIHAARDKDDVPLVKQLADYTIHYHYPQFEHLPFDRQALDEGLSEASKGDKENPLPPIDISKNKYAAWFTEVAVQTAITIAKWQAVGFTHGVMNTDNMSILGLTIDYGPFGFLDAFDPKYTPNTTDLPGRRYGFANQPDIGLWNVMQLANTLYTAELITAEEAQFGLGRYADKFMADYQQHMSSKVGLKQYNKDLLSKLLNNMAFDKVDYTNFFRSLGNLKVVPGGSDDELLAPLKNALLDLSKERKTVWLDWVHEYFELLAAEGVPQPERKAQMDSVNPKYVLRNYLCQSAIDQAEQGDFSEVQRLLKLMERPYDDQPGMEKYARLPPAWAYRPGVCMLSCSS